MTQIKTCQQLQTQLETIKSLQDKFDNLLAKAKQPDYLKVTINLKSSLVKEIETLKSDIKETAILKKLEKAQEIFGEDLIGPKQLEKIFDFNLETKDIPVIPFSVEEMKKAKAAGQYLILRLDHLPDNAPLTIKQMKMLKNNPIKIKCPEDRYWEGPVKQETPRAGWALVAKEKIPGTAEKSLRKQIELLIKYIKKLGLSEPYTTAIKRHDNLVQSGFYQTLVQFYQQRRYDDFFEAVSSLELIKLTQPLPVEIVYDIICYQLSCPEKNFSVGSRTISQLYRQVFFFITYDKVCNIDIVVVNSQILEDSPNAANMGLSFSRRE